MVPTPSSPKVEDERAIHQDVGSPGDTISRPIGDFPGISELLVPLPGAALAKSRAAIKKVSIGEAEGERFEPSVPVRQSTLFNTAGSSNGGDSSCPTSITPDRQQQCPRRERRGASPAPRNDMRGLRRHPPLWSIAARCGGGGLRTAAIGGAIGASAPSRSAGIGKDASNGARATSVGGERSSGSSCGWIAFSNWTAMALVKW